MTENIHLYAMPEEESGKTFQFFKVDDKTIYSSTHIHTIGKPHRHKYFEIFIFINGEGKHEIDFKTYPLKSNSIHFLSPGQVHQIMRGNNYLGFEIIFNRDFYLLDLNDKESLLDLPFFNNNWAKPILNLNEEEFNDILVPIDEIRKEYNLKREISDIVLRAYLHIFLIKCKYYFSRQNTEELYEKKPDLLLLSKFRNMIEKHFLSRLTVQDYAEKLNLSPGVLNSKVKKAGGQNASEIIIDRMILEAKRLLLFTNLNNKEIAFRLNYEDPSYFSRVFKSKTGLTPSKFKAKMINKYNNSSEGS